MIHTLLEKRFNHSHHLIYMATALNNKPSIRALTPYYHQGSFYVITDANSKKMKEIHMNPDVAICGYFFNASGYAIDLGYIDNHPELAKLLIRHCDSWIQLGNVDIKSKNTCILQIKIIKGYIIDKEKRYEIDFS